MPKGLLTNQLEFFFAGYIFCAVIWFIIGILICIWVYRDAQSRGMSGVMWLIVVLLTGLLGLIIYLVVRTPKAAPPPMYGAPIPPPAYGAPPPPPAYGAPPPAYGAPPPPPPPMSTNCRYCGAPLPPGAVVCPRCGGRL